MPSALRCAEIDRPNGPAPINNDFGIEHGYSLVDESRADSYRRWVRLVNHSVRSGSPDDHCERLPENLQVERERPVLHVPEVQAHGLVPGQVGAAAHLPQAGEARLDHEAAPNVVGVLRRLVGQRGPGPTSDISPSRTLKSCGSSSSDHLRSQRADGGDPRIIADLKEHPVVVVFARSSASRASASTTIVRNL